jgi:hypothetical protein
MHSLRSDDLLQQVSGNHVCIARLWYDFLQPECARAFLVELVSHLNPKRALSPQSGQEPLFGAFTTNIPHFW